MTKRARGTSRPGQRRPTQRVGTRPARPSASVEPTVAPASYAETPATAADGTGATATPAVEARTTESLRPRRASGAFTASAAQEYAYVVKDVRRIAVVAGSLFAVMLVLFVLIDVLHVIRI
jgi:hypothetical protein